jgi:hypothetical protein
MKIKNHEIIVFYEFFSWTLNAMIGHHCQIILFWHIKILSIHSISCGWNTNEGLKLCCYYNGHSHKWVLLIQFNQSIYSQFYFFFLFWTLGFDGKLKKPPTEIKQLEIKKMMDIILPLYYHTKNTRCIIIYNVLTPIECESWGRNRKYIC